MPGNGGKTLFPGTASVRDRSGIVNRLFGNDHRCDEIGENTTASQGAEDHPSEPYQGGGNIPYGMFVNTGIQYDFLDMACMGMAISQ